MAAISSLCSCVCGYRRGDGSDSRNTIDPTKDPGLSPHVPCVANSLEAKQYLISPCYPLGGRPARQGLLSQVTGNGVVRLVTLSLYPNGFSFVNDEKEEVSVMLSPFSVVRNCKIPSFIKGKALKLSVLPRGLDYYFGFLEVEENLREKRRSDWTTAVADVIRSVTESIFPPFTLMCTPIEGVAATHRRLLAGYLVYQNSLHVASVVYAELHPQQSDVALLALYENENCHRHLKDIHIFEVSCLMERVGIQCSCFSIDGHEFSARTVWERKLWLRAISNLKVKLFHRAPDPTSEDLENYRNAIREYVTEAGEKVPARVHMDALLPRNLDSQMVVLDYDEIGYVDV